MTIRVKLTLLTLMLIFLSIIPASYIMLNRYEKLSRSSMVSEKTSMVKMWSKTVRNTLIFNGGDYSTTQIDLKDSINFLSPLLDKGLVYADSILLSSDKNRDGRVLAYLKNEKYKRFILPIVHTRGRKLILTQELSRVKAAISGFQKNKLVYNGAEFYEFVRFESMGEI